MQHDYVLLVHTRIIIVNYVGFDSSMQISAAIFFLWLVASYREERYRQSQSFALAFHYWCQTTVPRKTQRLRKQLSIRSQPYFVFRAARLARKALDTLSLAAISSISSQPMPLGLGFRNRPSDSWMIRMTAIKRENKHTMEGTIRANVNR